MHFTYVLQRSHLKSEQHLESLVSRESSFLFNNLVLLTACFVILWGTLFPILSEYVVGNKVTVGAPFYNRVAVPDWIVSAASYRGGSAAAMARHFAQEHPAQLCSAGDCLVGHGDCLPGGGCAAMEGRRIFAGQLLRAGVVCGFSGGADGDPVRIFAWSGRDLAPDGAEPCEGIWLLTRRNTRRYGGYIIHIGVVIVVIGLAGSAFNQNVERELACTTR